MSDLRYCLVCGANDEEVRDGPLSVCPLDEEDTPQLWHEQNCLEILLDLEKHGLRERPGHADTVSGMSRA